MSHLLPVNGSFCFPMDGARAKYCESVESFGAKERIVLFHKSTLCTKTLNATMSKRARSVRT